MTYFCWSCEQGKWILTLCVVSTFSERTSGVRVEEDSPKQNVLVSDLKASLPETSFKPHGQISLTLWLCSPRRLLYSSVNTSAVATSMATTILFSHWGDWLEVRLISPSPIPDSDVRPQGLTAGTPVLGTEHLCIPTYKCQWRLLHCTPAEVLATLLLIHSKPRLTDTFGEITNNVLVLL